MNLNLSVILFLGFCSKKCLLELTEILADTVELKVTQTNLYFL